MNQPLVTIAIPTYNNAAYIADAVKSAMAQDYPNLEIIILDDASEDNTQDLVTPYENDPRVRYYRNDRNIGRVANYHKALHEQARGEWYLNLDGDDYLTDNTFISKAISWIQQFESVVMVTGACERLVDDKLDQLIRSKYNEELTCIDGKTYFLDLPSLKASFIHLATLYNRAKAMALNFYSEDILSTDLESLYRLILTGNIISYDKVVGVWRIHGENESSRNMFSVDKVIKNFSFVESPAGFARTYLAKEQVQAWRKTLLLTIIEGYIIKVILRRPKNSLAMIFRLFKKYPLHFTHACWRVLSRNVKKLFRPSR